MTKSEQNAQRKEFISQMRGSAGIYGGVGAGIGTGYTLIHDAIAAKKRQPEIDRLQSAHQNDFNDYRRDAAEHIRRGRRLYEQMPGQEAKKAFGEIFLATRQNLKAVKNLNKAKYQLGLRLAHAKNPNLGLIGGAALGLGAATIGAYTGAVSTSIGRGLRLQREKNQEQTI